jgi:ankyrin repeat protein
MSIFGFNFNTPSPQPPQPQPSLCKSLNDCIIVDSEAIKIIKQLIKEGKDINEKNKFEKTPLMLAIEKHNIGLVKLLLIAGANPNIKDNSGKAALYKAVVTQVSEQNLDLLNLLINYKADVNAQSNIGTTPLMMAVEEPNLPVIQLLLKAGADPNIKDNDGNTALMRFEKNNKSLHDNTSQEIINILNATQKTGGSKRIKSKSKRRIKSKSKRRIKQ